jgi:UDP-N-acetylglucosamine 2-epimerase (non-hydrolysing)
MTGALAGFYHHVKVGHVEAGMRTDNRDSPFPEEMNRRIIARCASLHFAPTPRCAANLRAEGVADADIAITGNTVVDALLWMRDAAKMGPSRLPPPVAAALEGRRLVLVTTHRRENFGPPLVGICQALQMLARSHRDVVIVLPVHPNPVVRETVTALLSREPNILLTSPQPYAALVELMDRASLILTDSGGLQEEGPTFGTPVLVLRENTERPEGVEAGVAALVGTSRDDIVRCAHTLLVDSAAHARMSRAHNPYGDGAAAERIVTVLAGATVEAARWHAASEVTLAGAAAERQG